jgi:hypothetical protein
MRLLGRDQGSGSSLSSRLPGYTNDLRGNDPARWRTGIPQYGRVRFARVYPGIDLVFHGEETEEVEYDFDVAPGGSPDQIVVEFDGAESVRLGSSGELIVDDSPRPQFRCSIPLTRNRAPATVPRNPARPFSSAKVSLWPSSTPPARSCSIPPTWAATRATTLLELPSIATVTPTSRGPREQWGIPRRVHG